MATRLLIILVFLLPLRSLAGEQATPSFALRWRTQLPAPAVEPIALSRQGLVYVLGSDGKLRAVDSLGRILWEYPAVGKLPPTYPSNLMAAPDGSAIVAAGTNIYSISSSGQELWKASVGEQSPHWLSKVACSDTGLIFCASRSLVAIDSSGKIVWKLFENQIKDEGHSDIAVHGSLIFFAVSNILHKISTDGVLIKSQQLPHTKIFGLSVIDGEHLLAAVRDDPRGVTGFSKIDSDLSEVWFYSLQGGDFGDSASVDPTGRVFVNNGDGVFAAIDKSGLSAWRRQTVGSQAGGHPS